jgi:hypothetical protein
MDITDHPPDKTALVAPQLGADVLVIENLVEVVTAETSVPLDIRGELLPDRRRPRVGISHWWWRRSSQLSTSSATGVRL